MVPWGGCGGVLLRNILIKVQYEGTAYEGWQRQDRGRTVQGELESAYKTFLKNETPILGASRTDSGVHARAQMATFRTAVDYAVTAFDQGVNAYLPPDIKVFDAKEVPMSFNPIEAAKMKTYRYFFNGGSLPNVFWSRFSHPLYRDVNVNALMEAAALFVGEHDFMNFRTGEMLTQTNVRKIFEINWKLYQDDIYFFEIKGNGFLRHMIRNMLGALIEVARGKASKEDLVQALAAKKSIKIGSTLPPQGLFLWKIEF